MKPQNIKNIHMRGSGAMVAVHWELPTGEREHVWLEVDQNAPELQLGDDVTMCQPVRPYLVQRGDSPRYGVMPVLYRNRPLDAREHRTSRLNASAKSHVDRVQYALLVARETNALEVFVANSKADALLKEREDLRQRAAACYSAIQTWQETYGHAGASKAASGLDAFMMHATPQQMADLWTRMVQTAKGGR